MDYAFDLKRFLCIFRFMIKRTVEEQILRTISFLESGRVFSSTDFADIANQNTIRTALRRLTLAKKIDALGHSLYYKRICTKEFPYGYRPKHQSIANAIARRFSWKIFPTLADTFAYFGLDKSGDFVFPSTGPNKKFEFDLFEYPRPVEFRHIPLKLSRIADKKAFMYVQALVALGKDSEEMKRIFAKTSTEDLRTVIRKIAYAPLRIQNVFLKELKSRDNGKSDSGNANAENINNAFHKVQENRKLARIFRSLS